MNKSIHSLQSNAFNLFEKLLSYPLAQKCPVIVDRQTVDLTYISLIGMCPGNARRGEGFGYLFVLLFSVHGPGLFSGLGQVSLSLHDNTYDCQHRQGGHNQTKTCPKYKDVSLS